MCVVRAELAKGRRDALVLSAPNAPLTKVACKGDNDGCKRRYPVPLSASIFVADHLRPAAKKTGVHIEDGQRFGLHNLRHSLSNWLVNKAKVEPKTVQGILRHAKIQTTLDLYTQDDGDETRAAQGEYLTRWEWLRRWCSEVWAQLWVGICGTTLGNLLKVNGGPGWT